MQSHQQVNPRPSKIFGSNETWDLGILREPVLYWYGTKPFPSKENHGILQQRKKENKIITIIILSSLLLKV